MAPKYAPARGYWRTSGRHLILWAALGTLDRLQRQAPEERNLRRHQARLARLLAGLVSLEVAEQLWRWAQEGAEAEAAERLVAAVEGALFQEVQALRAGALAATRLRLGLFPPDLEEAALQEAFHLVRRVPETLKDQLRDLMRKTLAEQKSRREFARAIRKAWAACSKERAELIARTEWTRVTGKATLEYFRLHGLPRKAWVTVKDPEVCALCRDNAAAGPIPLEQPFPSGDDTVPAHPRCRCHIAGIR